MKLARVANVVEHHDGPEDFAARILNRRRGILNRYLATALGLQRDIVGQAHDAALA